MAHRHIPDYVKDEYLEWLLTPPAEREPGTKEEFAAQHGIVSGTLRNWEKTDRFQDELRKLKGLWGARWYGDILGRLMSIVVAGGDGAAIQASKVLLQHLEVGSADEQADGPSKEQLDAIRSALVEEGYTVVERAD